jgi:hypothetical protein
MRKISKWFQDFVYIFKTKTNKEDRLLKLLKSIGFKEKSFVSLAFDQQFRSVLKKTNYSNYIGVLTQRGDQATGGITATLYVRVSTDLNYPSYSIYLIVSSYSKPICVFKHAPELIIPLMFDDSLVHSMITTWLESIITLYVTRNLSKMEYEKEPRIIQKIL